MPGYEDVLQEAESTLDRVDAALSRLAEHSYGICTQCGDAISDERLALDPSAEVCASHEA